MKVTNWTGSIWWTQAVHVGVMSNIIFAHSHIQSFGGRSRLENSSNLSGHSMGIKGREIWHKSSSDSICLILLENMNRGVERLVK